MSRDFISPGVGYIESEDKSNTVPVEQTLVGIIGFAVKGPYTPKEIATVRELHDTYGYALLGKNSNGDNVFSKAIAAAERILKYSKKVIFCRLPISEEEQVRFTVSSDKVDFEIADSDCTIQFVKLTQMGEEGNYTYSVQTIDVDGVVTTYIEECTLSELREAMELTGKFADVDVKEENFPLDAPAEVTSHSYTIKEDASVEDYESAIAFEVYQPSEKIAENITLAYDDAKQTFVGESDSISVEVVQKPAKTVEVANFVLPGPDEPHPDLAVAHTVSMDFTAVEVDPEAEEIIEFDPVTHIGEGTALSMKNLPYWGNLDTYLWSGTEPDLDADHMVFDTTSQASSYGIGFKVYNGTVIDVTQNKIDTHVTETIGNLSIDYSKLSPVAWSLLPMSIILKKNSSGDYGLARAKASGTTFAGVMGTSDILDVFDELGAGFATVVDPSADLVSDKAPWKVSVYNDDALGYGGVIKDRTHTFSVKIFENDGTALGHEISSVASSLPSQLEAAIKANSYIADISKGEGYPVNADNIPGLNNYPLKAMKLKYNTAGTIDISMSSNGTDFVGYTTVAKADIQGFLESKTVYHLDASSQVDWFACFDNVTRKAGVSDRNFPIEREPLPALSRVEVSKSGTAYNVVYYVNSGSGIVPVTAASAVSAGDLISTCNDTIDYVTVARNTASDDRDFPIAQEPLVVYDKLAIVKERERYTITASKGTTINDIVAKKVAKDVLITRANTSGIVTLTKKSGVADRDFPIKQDDAISYGNLKIEKVADDDYKITLRMNGEDKILVLSTTADNLITALSSATVDGIVPVKNIEKLTDGVDYPIVQSGNTSSITWTISASAIANLNELSASQIKQAFDFFSNTESVDVSVLIAPYGDVIESCILDTNKDLSLKKKKIKDAYTNLNNYLVDIATTRGECMVVLDYPTIYNYDEVKKFFVDNNYLCSNSCTCYPAVTYTNSYLGMDFDLPASAIMATQMVYTDQKKGCWFAPAGFGDNKGCIVDAKKVAVQLTKEQRDELYELRINPVMSFLNSRIALWGNRTFEFMDKYGNSTPYQQINVRRLANYIRKVVIDVSMDILFEPNDSMSWNQWKNKIRPLLREIQNNRGCEAYKIVMDRTTITDEDIANGRAPGAIYVMPTMAIEYIPINFVMTRDGAVFSENDI